MEDLHICIFGDSITWWAFDSNQWGWADRIKIKCMENKINQWIEVYNLWISGKTSDNLVSRFEAESIARDCDVAIVAIGINDSSFIGKTNNNVVWEDTFKNNLDKIYKISIALKQTKIVFIWLTPVDELLTNPYQYSSRWLCYNNETIQRYDSIIKSFCNDQKIPYIHLMDIIKLEDLSDGLHPNEKWHKKIADRIYEYINKSR